MHKMTAAHKTLPLGTFVQVTNMVNGNTTIVRINDRGPFVEGREIDLSYAAAKDIGLVGPGVVPAKIVALAQEVGRLRTKGESLPLVEVEDFNRGDFTIQVGAFRDKDNALKLADRLKAVYGYVNIVPFEDQNKEIYYRVRVSRSQSLIHAGEIEKRLKDMGLAGAFIVRI